MIQQVLLTLNKILTLLRQKFSKGRSKSKSTPTPEPLELSRHQRSERCRKDFANFVNQLEKMPDDVLIQY